MHETSIALGILDIINDRCIAEGYHAIESVRLRIGRAAGIMPEALLFSFDVQRWGPPLRMQNSSSTVSPLGECAVHAIVSLRLKRHMCSVAPDAVLPPLRYRKVMKWRSWKWM